MTLGGDVLALARQQANERGMSLSGAINKMLREWEFFMSRIPGTPQTASRLKKQSRKGN